MKPKLTLESFGITEGEFLLLQRIQRDIYVRFQDADRREFKAMVKAAIVMSGFMADGSKVTTDKRVIDFIAALFITTSILDTLSAQYEIASYRKSVELQVVAMGKDLMEIFEIIKKAGSDKLEDLEARLRDSLIIGDSQAMLVFAYLLFRVLKATVLHVLEKDGVIRKDQVLEGDVTRNFEQINKFYVELTQLDPQSVVNN